MGEILKKATQHNTVFWVCLIVSICLITGGAIVPPPFVIDSSIFIATGMMFGFAALDSLNKAIDKGVDAKVKHGDTELHIINDDNNTTNTIEDEQ